MDGFTFVVLACGVAILFVFLAIGKWYPGSGADVLDWKPTRSVETEIELELDDVEQMIEAQNERRRRSGRPERTEEDVRAEVEAAERDIKRIREEYLRSQGITEEEV
jgi:hypothetical protein